MSAVFNLQNLKFRQEGLNQLLLTKINNIGRDEPSASPQRARFFHFLSPDHLSTQVHICPGRGGEVYAHTPPIRCGNVSEFRICSYRAKAQSKSLNGLSKFLSL